MINGGIDTKPLDDLLKKLKDATKKNGALDQFYRYVSHQVMARILSNLYKRTPVEKNDRIKYYGRTGTIMTKAIKGGALRRGWFEDQDISGAEIPMYAETLPVEHSGKTYRTTISNTQEYAVYVEYGHRPATGHFVPFLGKEDDQGVRTGAVIKRTEKIEGQYILRDSVHNVKRIVPALIEREAAKLLEKLT